MTDPNDDITNDPDFQEWAKDVEENMLPKLSESPLTISLMPTTGTGLRDVKYAVELGFSILLDKPIILAIQPGTPVPAKLAKVADEIVEIDLTNSRTRALAATRMREAMDRVTERLGL